MEQFKNLESSKVFDFFHEMSQIPRESKKEEKISNYLKKFAEDRNLWVEQDGENNIIIKKEATASMKSAPTVILQAHMDMVCEKGKDSTHNFDEDPIEWVIKDDYIYANDTTLGADNGIGACFALALLDSSDIEHPALEVVVTTDEETGMTGANFLDTSILDGKIFINIDSEEEGLFFLSCAGGNDTRISIPVNFEMVQGELIEVDVTGLLGGHSGMEIIKERANASKVIGRYLNVLTDNDIDFNLVEVHGGSKMNAITRDAHAKIVVNDGNLAKMEELAEQLRHDLKAEYTPQDPDATINITKKDVGEFNAMSLESSLRVVAGLVLVPFGPQSFSQVMDNLVQTSSNIGVVETTDSSVEFLSGLRSSVTSQKQELVEVHNVIARLIGADIKHGSFYPAWPLDPNSRIKEVFLDTYKDLFNEDATVEAIHAGLECGIFKEKMGEDVDFISFGPNMYDVHTAEEHVSISSIDKNWKFFKKMLANLNNY
ncbi:MAG: aminoacyl-histidine dipeptidase [Erysipelotrichales bacterium]